ncbi:MAG: PIG-L deacetylase family protein [Candidatus Paceibacterales bacterium]
MKNKILAISAHPDDLDFACAGTTAKLVKEGNEVFYLIVSDGSKGTRKVKFSQNKLTKIRKKEQKKAAKVLGVKKVFFLGLMNGEIENTKSLRKELVKIIRRMKPDIIFSFDPGNLSFDNIYRFHRDHRQVAEAVFDAIYPAVHNSAFFPELLKKGYKPYRIKEIWFFATANPNKFVDITKTIEKKIEALSCHQSQIFDIKEIAKRIKNWAKKAGRKRKYKYAELFRVVKPRD